MFHHGNGDGSRCDRIADGRTGDHSAERGRNDRDFCGAACVSANERVRHVDKEGGDAGSFKESAEDNEYEYILRADLYRCSHNAGRGIEQRIDDLPELFLRERIDQKRARNAQDRNADASSAQFDQTQNSDYTYRDEEGSHLGRG